MIARSQPRPIMATFCKWLIRLLAVVYLLALAIGLVETFGWFGQPRDPLAWV